MQVFSYKPTVTDFSRASLAIIGCELSQAATPQGRKALLVWMSFSLADEVDKCVASLSTGDTFTAKTVIEAIKVANPQALVR